MNNVDHPAHYQGAKSISPVDGTAVYEPIKVIEQFGLGFCMGNALKYILRAKFKGRELEDLKKALWYLERRIPHGPGPVYSSPYTPAMVAKDWSLDGTLAIVVGHICRRKPRSAFDLLETHIGLKETA